MKAKKILLSTTLVTASLFFLAQPASAATSQSSILKQVVSYTNAKSSGLTHNYYWKNGAASLSGYNVATGKTSFTHDSRGRSGVDRATLTYAEYKASQDSRQGEPLQPPFWQKNPKVAITFSLTKKTYHGYLYNRSHSIADSLLGKLSYTSKYNFTTGTRSQNVGANENGGMRAAEELAENYWKAHPNTKATIKYQTTPLYQGAEKIPRGSVVDEKSSDGKLNSEVVVLNGC